MGNVGIMGSGDIGTYTEPLTIWYQENQKKDSGITIINWILSLLKGRSR
jgi:hypothetical protein